MPANEASEKIARLAEGLAAGVREAGALALSMFGAPLKQWTKGASSPVSEADIAVNTLLHERLGSPIEFALHGPPSRQQLGDGDDAKIETDRCNKLDQYRRRQNRREDGEMARPKRRPHAFGPRPKRQQRQQAQHRCQH